MAKAWATAKISTDGARQYDLRVSFSGSMGLCPLVEGWECLFRCGNDHDRIALKKILEQAVQELDEVGKVGR